MVLCDATALVSCGRRRKRSDEAPARKLGVPETGCDDTERMLGCCCEFCRVLVIIPSSPKSAGGCFTISVGCAAPFCGCQAIRGAADGAEADDGMRTGGRCVLGAGGAGAGDGAGGRRRERSDEAPDRKLGMPPGCDDTERMLCCCCCERRTITSDPQSAAGGFTFSVGCESFRGCPAMRDAAAEAAADGVGVLSVMTFALRVLVGLGVTISRWPMHANEASIASHSPPTTRPGCYINPFRCWTSITETRVSSHRGRIIVWAQGRVVDRVV